MIVLIIYFYKNVYRIHILYVFESGQVYNYIHAIRTYYTLGLPIYIGAVYSVIHGGNLLSFLIIAFVRIHQVHLY